MELVHGKIGKTYVVEDLNLEGPVERRLQALGLTKGTKVEVLNNKKSGTIIFKVRGTRLAIGKRIAEAIFVQEAAEWERI